VGRKRRGISNVVPFLVISSTIRRGRRRGQTSFSFTNSGLDWLPDHILYAGAFLALSTTFTDTRSEYWSGATFIAGGVLAGALWWQGSEGMKKANAYLVDALIFDRVRAPSVEAVADLSIPPTDYARASR
jgi:hypothetical protein